MADPIRDWDGDAWEEHCMNLLRLRYGQDLQEIPAERKPDLGIEAYSLDGALYQCYAPLEPLSVPARYATQRDKLTADVNKLAKNEQELLKLLGELKISRYVFLVPIFDGVDLPTHCTTKAQEVLEWGLGFIADDFQVVAQTDAAFPAEKAQLISLGTIALNLPIPTIDQDRVKAWQEAHETWIENLVRKVARLGTDGWNQAQIEDLLLTHYLAGQDMLGELREESPEVWELLEAGRSGRMNLLASEQAFDIDPPHKRFVDVRDREQEEYAELPGITKTTAAHLAWGTTAEWLLECSLDFPNGQ